MYFTMSYFIIHKNRLSTTIMAHTAVTQEYFYLKKMYFLFFVPMHNYTKDIMLLTQVIFILEVR